MKLGKQYESNQGRAMAISHAYLYDIPYRDFTSYIKKMQRYSKEDIVAFAKGHLEDNLVVIYKRQGVPEEVIKVSKPPITPVHINRHQESDFLKKVKATVVPAVHPEFLDYSRDIDTFHLPDSTRILYRKNEENETFHLVFYYRMGRHHDKVMTFAIELLPFLGTSKHSVEQINLGFFRLACSFQVNVTDEETTLSIDGLSKNMERALRLVEELLNDPVPDEETLVNRVENTLKARSDRKSDQNEMFSALVSFGIYGSSSPYKNILTENELRSVTPQQVADKIKDLKNIRHDILYYGNLPLVELSGIIVKYREGSTSLKPVPTPMVFKEKETKENRILFAPYDANQAKLQTLIVGGRYDRRLAPVIALFNFYFGDIVFQELREKRALAYTAFSRFQEPADLEKSYLGKGYIATQNDKIIEAFLAFDDLYNVLPVSEVTFHGSRYALLNKISTERIRRMNCIWNFLNAEKLCLNKDIRQDIFEKVSGMTMNDMIAFQQENLKDKAKTYLVLGKESDVAFDALEKIGPVTKLTLKDLFGY